MKRLSSKKRLWLVAWHVVIPLLLALLCLWGCPFYRLFGIRCPGCGLTRAWLCFLRGDWACALGYHRLFLPAPLFILLFIHKNTPVLKKWRFTNPLLYLFAVAFAVYHMVRIWR
ncbi:MAG: DUF2752 domain-containing protein [Clostridiaceae bacterium]|nr:DUF2752 domain-containing protein [Clostridiaceae bacterium]